LGRAKLARRRWLGILGISAIRLKRREAFISIWRAYLQLHADKLVILDEVQHVPALFQALRSLIDQGRRKGLVAGRFLLLGSASGELLR
jgi:uncharacterized protein